MRKALQMLGVLEDPDIEWLLSHGRTQTVPSESVLIREGEPIDALYIVIDGKLSVRNVGVGDKEIAGLFPGEIVGEISFVDSRPPVASVIAAQNSRVLAVPAMLKRGHVPAGFHPLFFLRAEDPWPIGFVVLRVIPDVVRELASEPERRLVACGVVVLA